MQTELSRKLGVEHAVFGFTPFPAVAAAISRAGGFGVLGAVRYNRPRRPQARPRLARRARRRPALRAGRRHAGEEVEGVTEAEVEAMIPEGHRQFVRDTLAKYGVAELAEGEASGWRITGWMEQVASTQLDVAFDYPIKLLANALGSPPPDVVARAHDRGVLVAALAGSARHARKHQEAGIDIVVAQGYEAGGHTGEIATMVLTPEIVDAVDPLPVLARAASAAGTGGCRTHTRRGRVCGLVSIWLTTTEADLHSPALTRKLLAAGSGDTVRSRALTGKPARQLRTEWTDAWDDPAGPGTLPMPLQGLLVAEAVSRIQKYEVEPLLGTPVGQIVGRMSSERSVQAVFDDLTRGFEKAVDRINRIAGRSGK
ncbi:NAD(P)H-dependent flavin oxidoreductase [Streptomyces puniciscabiei]|uniref:NAD(P)H-dependent flavin oxidoreductase n=1 Tax=Streptomyces puniciscabiei TaxID=164348 RepID=UPI001153CA37|nr:nitronate monooxygenase [Streptomyces puniciscabiei]